MGIHLRVLSESYPMNTYIKSYALDQSIALTFVKG